MARAFPHPPCPSSVPTPRPGDVGAGRLSLRVSTPHLLCWRALLPGGTGRCLFPGLLAPGSEWGWEERRRHFCPPGPHYAGRASSQEFRDETPSSKRDLLLCLAVGQGVTSLVAWLARSQGARSGRAGTQTRAFLDSVSRALVRGLGRSVSGSFTQQGTQLPTETQTRKEPGCSGWV